MIYILYASALSSLIYGLFFCNSAPSTARVLVKVGATALLTGWAYASGAPALIVAALAFRKVRRSRPWSRILLIFMIPCFQFYELVS